MKCFDSSSSSVIPESHASGETAEDFGVGQGFPGRRESGTRKLNEVVSVGAIEIGVFEEGSGGEDDVGEISGIGLELFDDYSEQILAHQTAANRVLVGRDGGRVAVVDHEGADGGIVEFRKCIAEKAHVYDAGFAAQW
jgi:hypothetical protein